MICKFGKFVLEIDAPHASLELAFLLLLIETP